LIRLELYIAELQRQRETTFSEFRDNFTHQLATERAFQAAIETCVDIASHIVATYQLGQPQESKDAFRFLVEANYMTPEYGQSMMAMVSFRNRLVHMYWAIDVERLYEYLQTDIVLIQKFYDFTLALLQVDE
jgi:uncharacterized protein YutE (UPF0331/DUF86 family)